MYVVTVAGGMGACMLVAAAWVVSQRNKAASHRKSTAQIDEDDATTTTATSTVPGTWAPNNSSRPWTPSANVESRVGLTQFVESTTV